MPRRPSPDPSAAAAAASGSHGRAGSDPAGADAALGAVPLDTRLLDARPLDAAPLDTGSTGREAAAPGARRGRPAPPRAPGRPEGGGPDLRDRLLDAAVVEFAGRGYAAARLRDIATAAGATPALLHYYFGGKPALLEAVIQERLMPVMFALREAVAAAGDDPAALIRGFVRTTLRIAFEHPWLPQLWVREVLHEGGALRGFLRERVGPMLPQTMVRRFAAAQAAGRLNPRIDARLLMPSLLGQTMFMAASAPIWREVLAVDEIDGAAVADHVLTLLEQGLELEDE